MEDSAMESLATKQEELDRTFGNGTPPLAQRIGEACARIVAFADWYALHCQRIRIYQELQGLDFDQLTARFARAKAGREEPEESAPAEGEQSR